MNRPLRIEPDPVPTSQVSELLSTCLTLHRDSRSIVGRIRGSLSLLQELRGQRRPEEDLGNGTPVNGSGARLRLEFGLTAREAEVALLLSQGHSNTSIASALNISTHTARHHTQRVLTKLRVHSRSAAGFLIRG